MSYTVLVSTRKQSLLILFSSKVKPAASCSGCHGRTTAITATEKGIIHNLPLLYLVSPTPNKNKRKKK